MLNQSVDHDLGQGFPCFSRILLCLPLFINDHDVSILSVLWEDPMFPDFLDQEVQATREDVSSVFENLCRDSSRSSAFIVLQPCNGLLDF